MSDIARVVLAAVFAAAVFIAMPLFMRVQQFQDRGGMRRSDDPAEREERNSSALGVIMGEFRTSISDMIFLKTERYLDSGIAYAPHFTQQDLRETGQPDDASPNSPEHDHAPDHTTSETEHIDQITSADEQTRRFEHGLIGAEERESAELRPGEIRIESEHTTGTPHEHHGDHDDENHDHHDHDHDTTTSAEDHPATIIATPEKDFRGVIGYLERQVKPWRDPREPHQHTPGTELLPWYRLATLVNPRDIRSYSIGTWWLKSQPNDSGIAEAAKFVAEGIANNPDAYQLHLMQGYILRKQGKDRESLKAFERAAELALKVRPPDGKIGSNWTNYEEDDAIACITMSLILSRDLDGYAVAYSLAEKYAASAGESIPILNRLRKEFAEKVATEGGPKADAETSGTTSAAVANMTPAATFAK